MISAGMSSRGNAAVPADGYVLDWKRWIMISVVACQIFFNTVTWISYATVAKYTNAVYGEGTASWLSLIFLIVTIPMGAIGILASKKLGSATCLYVASIAQFLGGLVRWWSFHLLPSSDAFIVCMIGQVLSAIAYPLIMFLPSKISADWFPENERTLATTIGVMAAPFGVMFANIVAPVIVRTPGDTYFLNFFLWALGFALLTLTLATVRSSAPKNPPGYSAKVKSLKYFESFLACFKSPVYIALLLVIGGGVGMFNCLYTMMQEMMCPKGYNNIVAGGCACVMILAGIVGAFIAGVLVDKYQCHQQIFASALVVAVVAGVSFLWMTRVANIPTSIFGIVCALFGFSGLALYPVGLELAAESTFPAAPEVVTGTIILVGQFFSAVFVSIFKIYATPMKNYVQTVQKCQIDRSDLFNIPQDYTVSIMILSAISLSLVAILAATFLIFSVELKRREQPTGAAPDDANANEKCFPCKF